jgi:hypothetical protein
MHSPLDPTTDPKSYIPRCSRRCTCSRRRSVRRDPALPLHRSTHDPSIQQQAGRQREGYLPRAQHIHTHEAHERFPAVERGTDRGCDPAPACAPASGQTQLQLRWYLLVLVWSISRNSPSARPHLLGSLPRLFPVFLFCRPLSSLPGNPGKKQIRLIYLIVLTFFLFLFLGGW